MKPAWNRVRAKEIYQKDKNYFTTLTLVTNEQTLLQKQYSYYIKYKYLALTRSFPNNCQIEDRLDCARKQQQRTTTRTT